MTEITLDEIYVIEEDKKLNTELFERWKKWAHEVEENSSSKTAAMFYLQKTLNDFIDKKKGIVREDKNEWYERNVMYATMEVGETLEELKIKHWTKDKTINRKTLLEEYVDIWHFLMSAALDAGWENAPKRVNKIMEKEWVSKNTTSKTDEKNRFEAARKLIEMIECLNRKMEPCYYTAVSLFVESISEMGYTFDEFYKAYLIKNFKNFARQESPEFRGGKYF